MKPYKTLMLFFILCTMFITINQIDIYADSVEGTCGKHITWKLEDGVLRIWGKGNMPECKHKKLELLEGAINCTDDSDCMDWNYYNWEIKSVIIEEGITSISSHAFFRLYNAESIVIPSSVKTIGHAAFSGSGFHQIIIPDSVTSIGEAAFLGCGSLKNVMLPKHIKKIKKMTFDSCCSLKQVNIPLKTKTIGKSAFNHCCALKEISIPQTLKTIDEMAFNGCTCLEKINLIGKSTLQSIGFAAFSECSIKQFTIPASVVKIDSAAISGAKKIKVDKKNKKYKSKNGVVFSKNGKTLVCYPANKKGSTYAIPKGVKTIGSYAFSDTSGWVSNKYLKKVIMPDSVTTIKEEAFCCVKNLRTVRFSKKLKKVENSAFSHCSLTSLELPNSLTYIGISAFDCEHIKGTITIPKNVKTIKTDAFTSMFKIKKIVVKSKKLKDVGKHIFWGLKKNTKIYLPKSKQETYKKIFTKKNMKETLKFVYQ